MNVVAPATSESSTIQAMPTVEPVTTGWKVLTHDLCPPIQGGPAIWTGETPFSLPTVRLDTGDAECGAGWNYCERLSTAFTIAGLWPNGRPSRGFLVQPGSDAIGRGDKRRASTLTMLREATADEIEAAIRELSEPFGEHAERMAQEQLAWRTALARTERNAEKAASALRSALETRDLGDWRVQEFSSARDAWDAWDAWAAWAAWAAWDALTALTALTVTYAALEGWIDEQPDLLTTGIRDAYGAGLALAVPVGPKTLGYVLEVRP